jgi:hypothetical protein
LSLERRIREARPWLALSDVAGEARSAHRCRTCPVRCQWDNLAPAVTDALRRSNSPEAAAALLVQTFVDDEPAGGAR